MASLRFLLGFQVRPEVGFEILPETVTAYDAALLIKAKAIMKKTFGSDIRCEIFQRIK